MKFGHTVLQFEEELVQGGGPLSHKKDKIFSIYQQFKRGKKCLKSFQTLPSTVDVTPVFGTTPEQSFSMDLASSAASASSTPGVVNLAQEQQFFQMISKDVQAFNGWFADREEEAVMKLEVAKRLLSEATTDADRLRAVRLLVDLHGEMILVIHFVMLQFACLSKLLKKHDKVTGVLLRQPFLARLAKQPFFSTEVFERMIEEIDGIYSQLKREERFSPALEAAHADLSPTLGHTQAIRSALNTWNSLQTNVTSPSTFLPASLVQLSPKLQPLQPLDMQG